MSGIKESTVSRMKIDITLSGKVSWNIETLTDENKGSITFEKVTLSIEEPPKAKKTAFESDDAYDSIVLDEI